jgi:nucleotide-binding universal stress UspA family protein
MIEKILIPLDGSKLAEKALPYAEVLAEKFEAELILLQVLETVVVLPEFSDVSLYEAKVII